MNVNLLINGELKNWDVAPDKTLLHLLRENGYFGAKFGGCQSGECGACTVLLDGKPVNSCHLLVAQAQGHLIETIEAQGVHPEQGWKRTQGLHLIQQAMVETGAIQCGYCTPAMVLAARSLLEHNHSPTEAEVRDVLSGILCRCTGYLKPVQAILRAAAVMRGEDVGGIDEAPTPAPDWMKGDGPLSSSEGPAAGGMAVATRQQVMPSILTAPETSKNTTVGKPEKKVDSMKLVQGKPAFTDDLELRGMLVGKILHSTRAHAIIEDIDVREARALPGVAAVLTYQDLPRVIYSTAGQSDPIPGPLDAFSLDRKVRFVGDRVAFVAAESEAIADQALSLIKVTYRDLPAILDSRQSMMPGAVKIHDEPEYVNFADSEAE
ncbi:MAG: 2Fe-2S iron-sulfur cluster binding domain-containing protein, partial [Anaerolineae bacterium]|nr:2Fe-2S iron-sulfur cluster binding domain-containing protein [Anaerolineae bacterium]